jgi:PAS domain S-box-containing protein
MEIINFSKANCRNCYKCVRQCPVKAIRIQEEQAEIVADLCIGCGECLKICPQNAKSVKSDVNDIKTLIASQREVIVSLAPSFPGGFKMDSVWSLYAGLKKLGFDRVEETAIGAEYVSECYAMESKDERACIITTSCPTVNQMITKYYPDCIPFMSNTVSPMIAHGKLLKKKYPQAKVVFVGPCISKKIEMHSSGNSDFIDGVLTFDELHQWFESEDIDLTQAVKEDEKITAAMVSRWYPLAGGVAKSTTLDELAERKVLLIDGLASCMDLLNHIHSLKGRYWIEMNACTEGCINGAGNTESPYSIYEKKEKVTSWVENVNARRDEFISDEDVDLSRRFYESQDKEDEISEEAIREILSQTGKYSEKDELNCGACGYDTCREKAIAVYRGMAELDMCLPYMRNKNEAISNLIIESSPNAIVVLDKAYNVIEFNPTAERLFSISKQSVSMKPVEDVLGKNQFKLLGSQGKNISISRETYKDGIIRVLQTLSYIDSHEIYLGILTDITEEEKNKEEIKRLQENALLMAQEVIDKQMRVAHEIASLLGETTAETKITLTRLQDLMQLDAEV